MREPRGAMPRSALADAMRWLTEALRGGPRPSQELEAAALGSGITPKRLRRAREKLGVRTRREGFGPGGRWVWALPEQPIDAPAPAIPAPHVGGPSVSSAPGRCACTPPRGGSWVCSLCGLIAPPGMQR